MPPFLDRPPLGLVLCGLLVHVLPAGSCPLAGVALGQEIRSVEEAYQRLQSQPLPAEDAEALLAFFKDKYRGQDLKSPARRHLVQNRPAGGGYVAWFIESDQPVTIVAEKGRRFPMQRLGETAYWAWADAFPNFSSMHYRYEIDGRRYGGGRENRFGFESYDWQPESLEQPGVPKGEVIDMGIHVSDKYFPGAERQWWIYVPAGYSEKSEPLKLMVFNDGGGFVRGEGNACTVLDNLIHQKRIPPLLAVFINPGSFPAGEGKPGRSNRGNEYDTCTPRYASFLDEEILPLVRENYRISKEPWDHAICGSSSGASCAFTAAWHRNDLFRRVVSFVGSYCDFRPLDSYPVYGESHTLRGDEFGPWKTAHDYPGLIRKTQPRREIKIFLQDGDNDLDNSLGNWFQNNLRMASALEYAGYDFRFEPGHGMHSKKHGMSILPEILEWLWEAEGSDSERQRLGER